MLPHLAPHLLNSYPAVSQARAVMPGSCDPDPKAWLILGFGGSLGCGGCQPALQGKPALAPANFCQGESSGLWFSALLVPSACTDVV